MHPVPGGYIIRPYGVDRGASGSADCPGPGGWRADVGIGPYEAEPSNPGGNRESVRAAIQAAPTRKPGVGP